MPTAASARISLRGIDVAYDDAGSGPDAVLLVHGHPFDRSMWAPQVDAIVAAGWRAIAPDLRGYGDTTVVAGTTTLDQFADDVIALLDHLQLERIVLGGLSMGGQIVMEFARRYAPRLRAIILAATFPQSESGDGQRRRRAMAERLLAQGMNGYAQETLPKMLSPGTIARCPHVAEHVLRMMRRTSPVGAAAALRGRAERPGYEDVLARLTVPALIVVGDEDAFTTRDEAERMHALIAGSELVVMDGVGHMPNLERPDEFNRHVIAFLRGIGQ